MKNKSSPKVVSLPSANTKGQSLSPKLGVISRGPTVRRFLIDGRNYVGVNKALAGLAHPPWFGRGIFAFAETSM